MVNSAFTTPSDWSSLGTDDVALVTGGLSGLGLEITKKLLYNHGVGKVIVIDRHEPSSRFDSRVEFVQCDVAAPDFQQRLDSVIHSLHLRNQHISVVVNNAGVRCSGLLLRMDPQDIQTLFGVNTFAHITVLRSVVQNHLDYHRECQLSVVTVLSILGALAPRNLLVYSASKAAATQIHEALAQELRPYRNIAMLLVVPGQLTTEMFHDVRPTRTFFAPVVDHRELATKIAGHINAGVSGTLCAPMYAYFLPMVKILPPVVQNWCRRFSGMDSKIPDT